MKNDELDDPGIDVEDRDTLGNTALESAMKRNDIRTIEALVFHGPLRMTVVGSRC